MAHPADRNRPAAHTGRAAALAAGLPAGLHPSQRRAARTRAGHPGRYRVRIRLPGRRGTAVCGDRRRFHIHPGVSRPAHGAGGQCTVFPAVLLAHPAADRAHALLAAAESNGDRRRTGAGFDHQYLRGHGGGAALHPALSRGNEPQRAVYADDHGHGHHCRYGDVPVCQHPAGCRARRHGPPAHCLADQRSRSHRHCPGIDSPDGPFHRR